MLDIVGFDSVSEVVMMMIVTMNCKCVDEDARISIKVHSDGDGDGDSQECAKRQTSLSCFDPQNPSHPPFC